MLFGSTVVWQPGNKMWRDHGSTWPLGTYLLLLQPWLHLLKFLILNPTKIDICSATMGCWLFLWGPVPVSTVVNIGVIHLTSLHCKRLASSRGLITICWRNDWEEHRGKGAPVWGPNCTLTVLLQVLLLTRSWHCVHAMPTRGTPVKTTFYLPKQSY